MGAVDFSFGTPAIPFDTAPLGTEMAAMVVIGRRPDGSFALEQRLPSGVPFDPANPAHLFGWFVVNAAQDLMTHAMQMRRQAEAVHQMDETINANRLAA
jgi:hypothetical protein